MKIVIIGTVNKDLILPFQGGAIQSFGGIFYSISALSRLVESGVELIPVSFVGSDVYQHFLALLENYPNIHSGGLIPLDQKNHEVILEYIAPEERTEKALFNFPSLEWKHIKKNLKADFYIINMITGWDMTLKAFLKLSRKHFRQMYLDVHFLVMGMDKLGKRMPRCPENIYQWLRGARFIQMNKKEFSIMNPDDLDEASFFEKYMKPEQILMVTQGSEGVRTVFQKNGMIRNKHFSAYEVEEVADVTGCGDVFGAAFAWQFQQSQDLYQSVDYANKTAAANCMLKGTNEMDLLNSKLEKLSKKEV